LAKTTWRDLYRIAFDAKQSHIPRTINTAIRAIHARLRVSVFGGSEYIAMLLALSDLSVLRVSYRHSLDHGTSKDNASGSIQQRQT
jgi:hypothetical protein